jgi:hypothetical protein
MHPLLRLLIFALLIALAAWGWRQLAGARKSKCSTCRFARKVFDDGTLCTFGTRETFKNNVHVQNCVDHRPRARRTRPA